MVVVYYFYGVLRLFKNIVLMLDSKRSNVIIFKYWLQYKHLKVKILSPKKVLQRFRKCSSISKRDLQIDIFHTTRKNIVS